MVLRVQNRSSFRTKIIPVWKPSKQLKCGTWHVKQISKSAQEFMFILAKKTTHCCLLFSIMCQLYESNLTFRLFCFSDYPHGCDYLWHIACSLESWTESHLYPETYHSHLFCRSLILSHVLHLIHLKTKAQLAFLLRPVRWVSWPELHFKVLHQHILINRKYRDNGLKNRQIKNVDELFWCNCVTCMLFTSWGQSVLAPPRWCNILIILGT